MAQQQEHQMAQLQQDAANTRSLSDDLADGAFNALELRSSTPSDMPR
jgi:hypothetical protein